MKRASGKIFFPDYKKRRKKEGERRGERKRGRRGKGGRRRGEEEVGRRGEGKEERGGEGGEGRGGRRGGGGMAVITLSLSALNTDVMAGAVCPSILS